MVAHDPVRAGEQSAWRRQKIAKIETFTRKLVSKLDAQDTGQSGRPRTANDRGTYSRLDILRRLQQHRVPLGNQNLTGIGKTSPQQLELFEALDLNILT